MRVNSSFSLALDIALQAPVAWDDLRLILLRRDQNPYLDCDDCGLVPRVGLGDQAKTLTDLSEFGCNGFNPTFILASIAARGIRS